MNFIDLHCDTASKIYYDKLRLKNNVCKVNIDKLKKGEALGQVFAFFIDQDITKTPFEEFLKLYNNFKKELYNNLSEIEIVTNIKQLEVCNKNNKIGAFLSIEEGEVIEGSIEKLREVYKLEIRIITLTWNYENKLGFPNANYIFKENGLTTLGKELLGEIENLGIIPDASHLSDGGFYDLVKLCKKPFIASHSNARQVTNHPRNLTDEMIKLLSDKGGVMGINFCSSFLGNKEISCIDDILAHIKHIRNVGGIDVIAFGSDFDGIDNEVEIENCSEFYKLYDALKKNGFTEYEIEKIFYKNVKRVFSDVLK
ncbi:dipeptidase [Clostridium taeniosporum]|uniref:Membrane dipeptidase n=1 Tax=Clostridium taeniosporum TaxID=394958 RepID=A0A1D7XIF8_9CLOT|nr:dipeptidase [Clostridium taeniosporum]AOR23124.1 membrane dipeptidase [Clostridium taeniosporum]